MTSSEIPLFPRSVLSVSREEFGNKEDNPKASQPPLPLEVKEGKLPPDIQGHVYIVGPVGSVDSESEPCEKVVSPSRDGTTLLYNGDGMVYRLDFDNLASGVQLSTRIVKTPCYYADVATHRLPQYERLRFKNYGITRLSGTLGLRNQLNTAFLPMKFAQDEHERLLVTWDMGRPYEIDPKTLEAVTPVGRNADWLPATKLMILPGEKQPFQTVQSCAHPCFDPHKGNGQVVMVNTGRCLDNAFSQLIPIRETICKIFGFDKDKSNDARFDVSTNNPTQFYVPENNSTQETFGSNLKQLLKDILNFFRAIFNFFVGNFLDIIIWDGVTQDWKKNKCKWRIEYNGRPIKIRQSTHQIGLTEDYIIIVDTAFKLSVEELLPNLNFSKSYKDRQKLRSQKLEKRVQKLKESVAKLGKWGRNNSEKSISELERKIRELLDHPQLPDNYVYIVRRCDLEQNVEKVEARRVIIPYEAAHFLVDYKNPGGNITIHFSHVCAWDAAECITQFDFDDTDNPDQEKALARLYGVLYGPTDISRLGSWVIHGETGEVLENKKDILMDLALTWGPAIATYRTSSNYAPPDRLEDIYWGCLGCWHELLLPHILKLYENYEHREVGLQRIQEITRQGRKSNVLRLHIDVEKQGKEGYLSIADAYEFPEGYYVTSPQFVPSSIKSGSSDGYIVCIVHFGDGTDESNGNEIWILDGNNLKQGPICKLWHPQLKLGFTVHATWLQKAEKLTDYSHRIDPREDYKEAVSSMSKEHPQIVDLFEHWVYPQKEPKC